MFYLPGPGKARASVNESITGRATKGRTNHEIIFDV